MQAWSIDAGSTYHLLFLKKIIEESLIDSVMLISAVQQIDSYIYIFFFIMVYHGILNYMNIVPCAPQ